MGDGVLQVGADEPQSVAPDVIRALVASGADIVEVRPEQASLERVYFEIMGVTAGRRQPRGPRLMRRSIVWTVLQREWFETVRNRLLMSTILFPRSS